MMDVGQGDALLVTLPDGKTLLVDTGGVSLNGEFDIGDRVRARRSGPGITRLDYLAITTAIHHIGGAAAIVRDFRPSEICYGACEPSRAFHGAAGRSPEDSDDRRWLLAGDCLEIGGVELRVHHPGPADWQRQRVRNDDSLVIELRFEQVSVLLTGDIGRDVEEALATARRAADRRLEVSSHGSGRSSTDECMQKLRPRVVLISCGRANPYGHPVPHVLERYASTGSLVYRTDLDGQVELTTNGLSLQVEAFTGRRVPRA